MVLLFETSGLIAWGGLFIIAFFVFAETGFLLGLAIPGGETLVFTAGLLVSTGTLHVSIIALLAVLMCAGILGDVSGYYIGKKFGKKLQHKKNTWYFKQQFLTIAEDYLQRHNKTALIGGKFLPVIRPFSPVVSGMSGISFSRFITLSVVASAFYICTFALAGYYLGNRFPVIKDYLGWILPISIIIAISIVVMQAKRFKKKT